MKKKLLLFFSCLFLIVGLAACSGNNDKDKDSGAKSDTDKKDEVTTLKVAALESAYGTEMWPEIKKAYEKQNKNVKIELTVKKNLEEVVRPKMQAGEYPDVFLLATGRKEALTETMIKENAIEDISDVLDMNVYGEDTKVKDKLLNGFTEILATNPYGDGKTYLAPMFYSPTGLFYNAGLFKEKGWDVPATWDEMWELGDKAKKDGIALFTYPTTGYFDSFVGSSLYGAGGPELFEDAMTYKDGVWESDEVKEVFDTIKKLSDYTQKNTVANANDNDFTKNQQLILDNKALFMPNGNWVIGEMKEAPRADGFEWGMAPIPAFSDNGDKYAFTFFEQVWIPKEAKHIEAAKEFLTYLYSDEAADIFAKSGAVQPINGMVDKLDDEKQVFYNVYEDGALPAMGTFASTKPVPGVNIADALYSSIDSVMSGKLSVEDWQKKVEKASDKLREAMD